MTLIGTQLLETNNPQVVIDGLDELAEKNFLAMQATAELAQTTHNILGNRQVYTSQVHLWKGLATLRQAMKDFITCYDNAGYIMFFSATSERDFEEKFAELETSLKPHLDFVHHLFKTGYHNPLPIVGRNDVNVLADPNQFNNLFTKPVREISRILSGGSKPDVRLKSVETMEELIRVIHDGAIDKYDHLFDDILRRNHGFQKIKRECVNDELPNLAYFAGQDKEEVQSSPAYEVVRGIMDYCREDDPGNRIWDRDMDIRSGIMTARNIALFLKLSHEIEWDKVNASLHHVVDQETGQHNIKLYFGNKGYFGAERMDRVREGVEAIGAQYHELDRAKAFSVKMRVDHEDVREQIRGVFCAVRDGLKRQTN